MVRMRIYLLVSLALLTTGCRSLNRMLGVGDGSKAEPIHILGAGQSNANNTVIWSRLAARIETYTGRDVTWNYAAVSNTSSQQWAANIPMPYWGIHPGQPILDYFALKVQATKPTFVCWMQGEGDADTTAPEYASNIGVVIRAMHASYPTATFVTALESFHPEHQGDPRGGQMLLVKEHQALLGPDVDSFRPHYSEPSAPGDGPNPHFTEEGKEKIADAWFEALKPYLSKV